jgi:ubiquinone/menaquinone biosynthesis C-methylase UbiE
MSAGDSSPDRDEIRRRSASFWNEQHALELPDHDNFLNHPMVQAYVSLRAFGQLVGHMDVVIAELRTRTDPGDTILSVGCGGAGKERALARRLPDRHFVGIDIAEEILAVTRETIAAEGIDNLTLEFGDFNDLQLDAGRFRAILGLGAVHHVEALETFWSGCARGLTSDGVVLAQEYVGPDRFQWTDAQIEAGDQALAELVPSEHKVRHQAVKRPSVDYMVNVDPSEAVRSSELVPTCQDAGFLIEGFAGAGCALIQPVLMGQIHTFDPQNWSHNRVLTQLFELEDELMRGGVVGDDFAMFVARRPR